MRVWYNSDLKSKNFIVPGLIAVTMMIIAAMLTSLTIAREWENGTMEQLLSTPVRPRELVLGKLLAYFALGLADMLICVMVGVFIFQVPFRGSVWFLFFSSCLFLFGALFWGIFISATAAYPVAGLTSWECSAHSCRLSAVGICVLHREHAESDSADQRYRAGALLRHHSERRVPEGRRLSGSVGRSELADRVCRAGVSGRVAKDEAEGGVT